MHDSSYDLPGGERQRRGLMRKESRFFSYGGAPCWLLLSAVLPVVRVGKLKSPAVFITLSHARRVLEMTQRRRLYNLQLLTNLNVRRRDKKQIQEYDFGLNIFSG